ncbi:MAG: Mlc titration factor MtfA (ptsG expression regulator) [Janthinobacterium sp.]
MAVALSAYCLRWRRARAWALPMDRAALDILTRNIPAYKHMAVDLQAQLQRLVTQFLYQKKIIGCAGLDVTEEMRITIAGLACLLLLNRPTKVYPALHTILLYPHAFVVDTDEIGPGGVVSSMENNLLGESWDDGRVILAWDHVQIGAPDWVDGQNVVLHEFAHQLDSESGESNGAPFLGSFSSYRSWATVLSRNFAKLQYDAIHQHHSVLDYYGATSPAEFFAVATETFFEKSQQMSEHHPDLFEELAKYYKVDPRAWLSPPVALAQHRTTPVSHS